MRSDTVEVINDVFCDVLEQLAFLFGEPMRLDELDDEPAMVLVGRISYLGPTTGTLCVLAPAALVDELAGNVLGVDPDDEEAIACREDVFGELLNVTLGRLLTELEGEAPVFDLTPPEVMLADDAAPWLEAVANPSTHAFTVDGSPVLLRLTSDV